MKLSNKIQQTVKIGTAVLTQDVRNVTLNGGVMRGKVFVTGRGDRRKQIPVRCIPGHRVWLPL